MKKILVVDDDETIVSGLTEFLRGEDYETSSAYDRETAEELMRTEFFSIVVADLRLRSNEEGLALIDAVARISPRTRVASMTGFATPAIERELLARGAAIVLQKPFPLADLAAALRDMLAVIEHDAAEHADLDKVFIESRRTLERIARGRYALDADDTQDIVQEAWLLYLEHQREVRNPRAWLSGTVANLCRDAISRRCRSRARTAELHDDICYRVNEDDTLIVRQALGRVDPRTRALCTLLGVERRSYHEVSEALALPLGSIGPLYQRAKDRMRQVMA
jgi:RNA polymerase sigma factor (sigma-70 family)